MEYILLVQNDPHKLAEEVSIYLNDGWKLYGNPMVAFSHIESWYHYQALIKEPE